MSSKTSRKKCLVIALVLLTCMGQEANADFTFGEPTNLGPAVNSSAWDGGPSITADGLQLFFDSERSGGYEAQNLWVTTHNTNGESWCDPVNLGPVVNTIASDNTQWQPSVSSDGLELYFVADSHIWLTKRPTTDGEWREPIKLVTINSSSRDITPSISADGLSLYFSSNRPGGSGGMDIWVSTRETKDDTWEEPVNLGPTVNSPAAENASSISADGLCLFFTDYPVPRSGGHGQSDLYVAMRKTRDDEWHTPVNLGPTVNGSSRDGGPSISADGHTLCFHSNRPGGSGDMDLWQVSIDPVVDLNTDGIVDAADMCIIVDHWGTDDPLCDIGPMPWGDGIVDVQDLIVLAERLFEDI